MESKKVFLILGFVGEGVFALFFVLINLVLFLVENITLGQFIFRSSLFVVGCPIAALIGYYSAGRNAGNALKALAIYMFFLIMMNVFLFNNKKVKSEPKETEGSRPAPIQPKGDDISVLSGIIYSNS